MSEHFYEKINSKITCLKKARNYNFVEIYAKLIFLIK